MSNGREELARRLARILIADVEKNQEVPDQTLLEFADDILAADYTDPRWGPRRGDGGPAMKIVPEEE